MTENLKEVLINKNPGVPVASSVEKQLTTIKGTLTSPIQLRGENTPEPYYYSFIRLKDQSIDLPVIFKITPTYKSIIQAKRGQYIDYRKCGIELNTARGSKCRYGESPYCLGCEKKLEQEVKNSWIESSLKKGTEIELTGHYSNSNKNIRKSFTAYSYQLLN